MTGANPSSTLKNALFCVSFPCQKEGSRYSIPRVKVGGVVSRDNKNRWWKEPQEVKPMSSCLRAGSALSKAFLTDASLPLS